MSQFIINIYIVLFSPLHKENILFSLSNVAFLIHLYSRKEKETLPILFTRAIVLVPSNLFMQFTFIFPFQCNVLVEHHKNK